MKMKHRVGLNATPFFLRLGLGVIFVWAGAGKLTGTMEVKGATAASLANMGVIAPAAVAASKPAPRAKPEDARPAEPKPAEDTPEEPKPAPPGDAGQSAEPPAPGDTPASPAEKPAPTAEKPEAPNAGAIDPSTPAVGTPGARYSASDFPEAVKVLKVYGLALVLQAKSQSPAPPAPEPGAAVPTPTTGLAIPLWPSALGQGAWPVYWAWAVAITELAGGACVLMGLLTRFWALGLACVMLCAMWLTEIGPAVQSGNTMWGFLPNRDLFEGGWQHIHLQFALLTSALALAFAGAGRTSVDRALFGGSDDA